MAIVNVAKGGNAPSGTSIGDVVRTAGGDYLVVNPNTKGASYNSSNGLWSVKLNSGWTQNDINYWLNLGSSTSTSTTSGSSTGSAISSTKVTGTLSKSTTPTSTTGTSTSYTTPVSTATPVSNTSTAATTATVSPTAVGSAATTKVTTPTTTSATTGTTGTTSASTGTSTTTGTTGTTSTTGLYKTGNIVNVASGGNAPAGTQVGDIVRTAGGNYLVVSPGTAGASYNSTNGLWSVKLSSDDYVGKGTYNDAGVSATDAAKISALQDQYDIAKATGDTAGMQTAHAAAEAIRANYGYSGGGDGSQYLALENEEGTYNSVGLPTYEAQTDAVNSVYDAANDYTLATLQSAYDKSKAELEAYKESLPATYQEQANTLSAEAEKQKQQFNEYAAYSGLNSGTGSQAALALSNTYQSNLGSVRTAEANAIKDADNQLANLYVDYQNDIAEAIAQNEYERAAALLTEYQTAAQSVVSVAQAQANYDLSVYQTNQDTKSTNYQKLVDNAEALAQFGDFSGYLALGYTSDQITNMRKTWLAANPEIAINLGYGA